MEPHHQPGDIVRLYAKLHGWSLKKHNLIVEGEIDQRYAILASKLYQEMSDLCLVGKDLAVFPTGIGKLGGTNGIQRQLPTLKNLLSADFDENNRRVFHFVALMDSDHAGKQAAKAITGKHGVCKLYRDVFLLQRMFPRETRDEAHLERLIEKHNEPWKSLDCEIEDLLSFDLLDEFVNSNANVLKPHCRHENPARKNGGHHFEFDIAVKGRLCRFVEQCALFDDVAAIVEVLRSLRYFMGLNPDGVP